MVITRDHKHLIVAWEPGGAPSKATFLSSLVPLLQGRGGIEGKTLESKVNKSSTCTVNSNKQSREPPSGHWAATGCPFNSQ